MIVVALSSVCNYGMAQDPTLQGKAEPMMILLVLPKQYVVIENEWFVVV